MSPGDGEARLHTTMTSSEDPQASGAAPRSETSIRIGRLGGIPIRADTRLLGLVLLALIYLTVRDAGIGSALFVASTLILVFLSVLWHEAGHALCARRLDLPVHDIRLNPFFGATRMTPPRTPREELLVAMGGPLASLAAASIAGPSWLLASSQNAPEPVTWALQVLALSNALLGLLNLVPAFPMDGGRILRALLSSRIGFLAATRNAVRITRLLATLMLTTPLWFRPLSLAIPTALIGLVLLLLSHSELRRALHHPPPTSEPGGK